MSWNDDDDDDGNVEPSVKADWSCMLWNGGVVVV